MLSYLQLFPSAFEDLEELDDSEFRTIINAAARYAFEGIEPDLGSCDRAVRMVWRRLRDQIQFAATKSQSQAERRKKSAEPDGTGKNRNEPNGTGQNRNEPDETGKNQTEPNGTKRNQTPYIKDKDKEKDKDHDKDNARVSHPPYMKAAWEREFIQRPNTESRGDGPLEWMHEAIAENGRASPGDNGITPFTMCQARREAV